MTGLQGSLLQHTSPLSSLWHPPFPHLPGSLPCFTIPCLDPSPSTAAADHLLVSSYAWGPSLLGCTCTFHTLPPPSPPVPIPHFFQTPYTSVCALSPHHCRLCLFWRQHKLLVALLLAYSCPVSSSSSQSSSEESCPSVGHACLVSACAS